MIPYQDEKREHVNGYLKNPHLMNGEMEQTESYGVQEFVGLLNVSTSCNLANINVIAGAGKTILT